MSGEKEKSEIPGCKENIDFERWKTFNWLKDIKPGFDSWNGYKFFIREGKNEKWLGADVYSFELPDIYAQPDGDRNFRLVY